MEEEEKKITPFSNAGYKGVVTADREKFNNRRLQANVVWFGPYPEPRGEEQNTPTGRGKTTCGRQYSEKARGTPFSPV